MLDYSNVENYSLLNMKILRGNCTCFENKYFTNSEY